MSECLVTGFHNERGEVALCVPDTRFRWERSCCELNCHQAGDVRRSMAIAGSSSQVIIASPFPRLQLRKCLAT